MADREWFIQQQTGHQGPFSAEEIYRYFHEGRIRPESMMWKEGLSDWMPLKNCREIAHALDFNLRSEQLPKPLPPDALDLLKNNLEKKRQARPQLHPVEDLPPLPEAPVKSKERLNLRSSDEVFGEWDEIARNFIPNPALEKLRPDAHEFEFKPSRVSSEETLNTDMKEWEEFSGPIFSSDPMNKSETLSLWDEKKSQVKLLNRKSEAAEAEEAIPSAVPIRKRYFGWIAICMVVAIAAVIIVKVPNVRQFRAQTPSNEIKILQQDFAKLDPSKASRFDKVFSQATIDRPKFNLAMANDGAKIWLGVSARAFYRFEIELRSIPDRVMGGQPIHFSTVGQIQEGLGIIEVENLSFRQGKTVEAGLYDVTLRASRADNMARWLRFLSENTYTKMIVSSFSKYIYPLEVILGPEKILLSPGDEREAAIQIETYLAQIKENKRRPLLEQQQNLLTLQSLVYKLSDLMNEYRVQKSGGKSSYIRSYAKEIAPALQILAVPTPKVQVLDAREGDPDLVIPGAIIWSVHDTAEMAKKMALLSVQFVDSLSKKSAKNNHIPEKMLDELSLQLTSKLEIIEKELNAI
ncbi:MAG: DUF4339 domain-containing protein [Bdellovibrio sp.]|nr:DUF4339 domain-containing protein [Bdellovibrio sp.]